MLYNLYISEFRALGEREGGGRFSSSHAPDLSFRRTPSFVGVRVDARGIFPGIQGGRYCCCSAQDSVEGCEYVCRTPSEQTATHGAAPARHSTAPRMQARYGLPAHTSSVVRVSTTCHISLITLYCTPHVPCSTLLHSTLLYSSISPAPQTLTLTFNFPNEGGGDRARSELRGREDRADVGGDRRLRQVPALRGVGRVAAGGGLPGHEGGRGAGQVLR